MCSFAVGTRPKRPLTQVNTIIDMTKTYFGECPICRQGQLIEVESVLSGVLLLMCDDCESQWKSPAAARSFENALRSEEQVKEASEEKVLAAGWAEFGN